MFSEIARQRKVEASRWPDLLLRAQGNVAERLERIVALGGFGPGEYPGWLMGEAAVAVMCAEAMDALAGWHATTPELRATSRAWAADLRQLARLAATDMRALASPGRAATPVLEEWRVFLASASGSQRAGEALGAVALHARLFPGRAGPVLEAMCGMPFARSASRYLARRREGETGAVRVARDQLLDAYAEAALAAGAQRATLWELDVINQTGFDYATQHT